MAFKRAILMLILGFTVTAATGCQFLAILENIGGKSPQKSGSNSGVGFSSNIPPDPDPTAPRRSPTVQDPP